VHLAANVGLSRVNLVTAVRALSPSHITLVINNGVPPFDPVGFGVLVGLESSCITMLEVPDPNEDLPGCVESIHRHFSGRQRGEHDVCLLSAGTNAMSTALHLAFGGRPVSIQRDGSIALMAWDNEREHIIDADSLTVEEMCTAHGIGMKGEGAEVTLVMENGPLIPMPFATMVNQKKNRIHIEWHLDKAEEGAFSHRYTVMSAIHSLATHCGSNLFSHSYSGGDDRIQPLLDASARIKGGI
jgi:hypothetical protein